MAIPDPMLAMVTFLATDAPSLVLHGGRCYGEEIPADLVTLVSDGDTILKTTVIKRSGMGRSAGDRSRIKLSSPRFDVFSYGETLSEAASLDLAAYDALKQMVPHTEGSLRMLDAVLVAGPISLREEDTGWPFTFRTYLVTVAEAAVV